MFGNPFGTWRGFTDYESNLVIHFDWIALNDEIEYNGFVLEREMPDGSFEITVNLHVKDIYIEVYRLPEDWYQPAWMWIEELVLVGTMDYTFQIKFILEKEIPGGPIPWSDLYLPPGVRAPGAELPSISDIWYDPDIFGVRYISFKFTGMGSGDLVESGWLPPPSQVMEDQPEFWWFLPPDPNIPENPPMPTGETAKVTVQQIELVKPQFKPGHPNLYGVYFWPPCETIKIF